MDIKRYKLFEARHEQAVTELKEDILIVFEKEFKKFRIPENSFDELFDVIQTEFDKGEEPQPYITYREGGVNLIIDFKNKADRDVEIRGNLFGIYEAYGPAHAEVCCALDSKEFGFLHDKSYKSQKISEELIQKKIGALEKELSIWRNIK